MGNRVGCNKPLLLKRKGQLLKKVNWIILQGVGYWGRKKWQIGGWQCSYWFLQKQWCDVWVVRWCKSPCWESNLVGEKKGGLMSTGQFVLDHCFSYASQLLNCVKFLKILFFDNEIECPS